MGDDDKQAEKKAEQVLTNMLNTPPPKKEKDKKEKDKKEPKTKPAK